MNSTEQQYRREASCILVAFLVFAFALGIGVGGLLFRTSPPATSTSPDLTAPIRLRMPDGTAADLIPYAITRDGRTERLADVPHGAKWVVWFDGPALQVSYAEGVVPE